MLAGNIRRSLNTYAKGCKCIGRDKEANYYIHMTHGQSSHPAYGVWSGMMTRCYKTNHTAYSLYGGRGIAVCKEWKDPVIFLQWIDKNNWEKGLQLDRIDNDSGYSPENCRIASVMVNANNRSNNRHIVINNKEMTISDAARKYNINMTTVRERLNRGWSDKEAVSIDQRDRALKSTNKSGITGVCKTANGKKWRAYINKNGAYRYLGAFESIEDARHAREIGELQ